MTRLPRWAVLAALIMGPIQAAALSVEPMPWGQLTFPDGPICRVKAYQESDPTSFDNLFVTLSWADGFTLQDWARLPSDIWRSPANTPGNAPMMRQVCGAVIASYRRRQPTAAAGVARPVRGVRPLPWREVLISDIVELGTTSCYVNFPSRPAPSYKVVVSIQLLFGGDARYDGAASPSVDWSLVPDEPARLALAHQICSDVQSDLGHRLKELP